MQKFLPRWLLVVLLILIGAVAAAALYRQRTLHATRSGSAPAGAIRPGAHLVIKVEGMDCVMCAAGLQNALRALPGVRKAEVSFQDKQAVLDYDPIVVEPSRFEKVITDSGYKVAMPSAPGR